MFVNASVTLKIIYSCYYYYYYHLLLLLIIIVVVIVIIRHHGYYYICTQYTEITTNWKNAGIMFVNTIATAMWHAMG